MKKYLLTLLVPLFSAALCSGQGNNSNSLLWKISGKNMEKPSYLFGTIHLPQKKFIIYPDSLYTAIQDADIFYNEVDFLHPPSFFEGPMLDFLKQKGEHFDSIQKTDSWKKFIDKVNNRYGSHLSYNNTDEFIQFSQERLGSLYEPEEGMNMPDIMLAGHATAIGKKTAGLETYQLQFNMLYDILDARLVDTTMDLDDEEQLTTDLKRFYLSERLDSMSMTIASINPTYRQIVFDRRNKTMSDSIEKHSLEGPCFFAIGSGHLAGPLGVIELLRKKGFVLTPVHSSNKISLLVINNMLKMADRAAKNKNEGIKDENGDLQKIKIDIDEETEEPPPAPPPPEKVSIKKAAPEKKKTKKDP